MPCSDGRVPEPIVEYIDRPETLQTNRMLMAIVCAILTELERNGIADRVIADAEENGKVKIKEVWDLHKKEDKARLSKLIEGLSEHEKLILKNML